MRAAKSLRALLIVLCLTFIATGIMAQKPAPINNETVNMILGTWDAEPYEMFGTNRTETVTYSLELNGQFMMINIDGKDETGFTYKGLIVVKVGSDGSITGWSYDDWGKTGTYSGKASGNKISVTGTKDGGSDSREIEINGNKMTNKVTFNFKDKEGKDVSISKTINLNKK